MEHDRWRLTEREGGERRQLTNQGYLKTKGQEYTYIADRSASCFHPL
ncbi:hypothetical protein HanXRQr2_Chr09g0395831 [Helianthus annuus]|uniref:Uncharacterized protein n=1 Tax=Helianthus annuus TaxID=4232 RepID=A0A9K3I7V6_HELAN|nr:hypothetical protein HanXRQr2_Chr09g0395831 [Helianthus annuus]KAJ0893777.1 hypothetical protein HanPSC8_Chr09g0381631 [Helianthus annuus]